MKTWFTTALLLCCAPLVVAQGELTEHPMPPTKRPHAPQAAKPEQIALRMLVRQLLIQHYDTNKNGRIDREEMVCIHQEAKHALKQQAIDLAAQFDSDKDGKLSPEEREAMRQSFGKQQRKAARRAPDGASCPVQQGMKERRWKKQAATEEGSQVQRPRKHRRRPRMNHMAREMAYISHQLMLQAYDKDGSGQLEEQEMQLCHRDAQALYEQRKADMLSRFDQDQDGRLSPDEAATAKEQLKPQRPNHQDSGKRSHFTPEMAEDRELLRLLYQSSCNKSSN